MATGVAEIEIGPAVVGPPTLRPGGHAGERG
jgi:hypothetical protein